MIQKSSPFQTIKLYPKMSDIAVIRTVKELREWKRQIAGGSLGFIPTMGALHQGHLSLGMFKSIIFSLLLTL